MLSKAFILLCLMGRIVFNIHAKSVMWTLIMSWEFGFVEQEHSALLELAFWIPARWRDLFQCFRLFTLRRILSAYSVCSKFFEPSPRKHRLTVYRGLQVLTPLE